MTSLLVLDNYDSFTYNLVHELRACGAEQIEVARNDQISVHEAARFEQIVLSPGPGVPAEAGIMLELIKTAAPLRRILGVCLGHQAIGEAFGARLQNLEEPIHGRSTSLQRLPVSAPLFEGLPETFSVGRYHSWVVDRASVPNCLEVLAVDEAGEVLALKHRHHDVTGVQFHPESILTEHGRAMLKQWLKGGV